VFDALTSDRPYRGALSDVEALETIAGDAGFDWSVVAALANLVCAGVARHDPGDDPRRR
jgi:HD-GYP domain-containing protein (c-di-GMP phosphodiesterase class II)